MDSKFTSGPWRAESVRTKFYRSISGAWFIRGPADEYIARLTDETRTDLGDPEEAGTAYDPREANARLIAAAPELLELAITLEDASRAYAHTAAGRASLAYVARELGEQARALLARVQGEG